MNGLLFISHQTEKQSYLESIETALKGGCKEIQLRMKDATAEEVEATGKDALKLCQSAGAKLYIDDHVEVCKILKADGVHLGKQDMPVDKARVLLGEGYIIGGTANTWEDIQRLVIMKADYIGLGPFRFTTTKKHLSPILGLEGYRRIVASCRQHAIHLPLFAIGGIRAEDIPALLQTGISGIALSSSILTAADPVEETKKIIHIINTYRS
ncbi:thiamine phosphate synthase [Parabacteroides sp. 52]|uniref:thiamine phosphate synthase n=1 Tax=unclassified Parabacteroides TaxID=2649774 RepID=UPI0013D73719|nr:MULTISPECIES: thiamine phosphate synthase [unclassified Parabacteroides]MDH6533874.1 thiamine-phosphate pyrophosphorylase [Parabacteroides sp. PM5-20]NDV54619.1 thiamine phosphate synthase [Parabacteroides sp. 52]